MDERARSHDPGVCFLSFAPRLGGTAVYQANQIAYLLGRSRVALVDEHPAATIGRLPVAAQQQVQTYRLPLWSRRGEALPVLREELLALRPQVIAISNYALLVRYAALLRHACREMGARLLLTFHSGVLTPTARRRALELVGSVAALLAHDVVYVSGFTRRYWEQRYPWMRRCPARVVYNGVPLPVEPLTHPAGQGPVRVGFVGRLEGEKDPALFCRVALAARAAGLDYAFRAYGEGSQGAALRQRYGEKLIQWCGQVEVSAQIFRAVDVLLMTSPVENCPYALLEAKSHGIPTVAPAVGGIPEILAHGVDGVLAAERTPAALLAGLAQAIAGYTHLSRGCLQTRQGFDLRAAGARMWGRYLA